MRINLSRTADQLVIILIVLQALYWKDMDYHMYSAVGIGILALVNGMIHGKEKHLIKSLVVANDRTIKAITVLSKEAIDRSAIDINKVSMRTDTLESLIKTSRDHFEKNKLNNLIVKTSPELHNLYYGTLCPLQETMIEILLSSLDKTI